MVRVFIMRAKLGIKNLITLCCLLAFVFVAVPAASSVIPIEDSQNSLVFDGSIGGDDTPVHFDPDPIVDPTITCDNLINSITTTITTINNTISSSGTGCFDYTAPIEVDHIDIQLYSPLHTYFSNKITLDTAFIRLNQLYDLFDTHDCYYIFDTLVNLGKNYECDAGCANNCTPMTCDNGTIDTSNYTQCLCPTDTGWSGTTCGNCGSNWVDDGFCDDCITGRISPATGCNSCDSANGYVDNGSGVCEFIPGYCTDDSGCAEDEICISNSCETLSCSGCEVASNHVCVAGCSSPTPHCDGTSCVQCLVDTDCTGAGEVCTNGTCTTTPGYCTTDTDCNGNETCESNSCTPLSCTGCQTASNHQCVNSCSVPTPYCNGSSCVECTSDTHCDTANGEVCSNNSCVIGSGYCTTDTDCNGNETCESNSCTPLSCTGCQTASNHQCVNSCGGSTPYCSGTTCVECTNNANCDSDEVCSSGSCQNLSCSGCQIASNHQCVNSCGGSTPYCSGATCVQCTSSSHCSGSTPYCSGNNCVECTNNTHCPDGEECRSGSCRAIAGYCSSDSQCAGDEECVSNSCRTLSCSGCDVASNHSCVSSCGGSTPYCSGSTCVECTSNANCSAGEECSSGSCRAISGYCTSDSNCAGDEECVSNSCTSLSCSGCDVASNHSCVSSCGGSTPYCSGITCVECVLDSHCNSEQKCQNAICVARCWGYYAQDCSALGMLEGEECKPGYHLCIKHPCQDKGYSYDPAHILECSPGTYTQERCSRSSDYGKCIPI